MKIFNTSFFAKKRTLLKENEYNYYQTTLQISANSKSLAVVGFERHTIEMTGVLTQRLRPLGHTTDETFQDLLLKQ